MPTPGPLELVIILVIALLILGPGKLPEVGSALGKSIREFRKASADVQEAVKLDTSAAAGRRSRRPGGAGGAGRSRRAGRCSPRGHAPGSRPDHDRQVAGAPLAHDG